MQRVPERGSSTHIRWSLPQSAAFVHCFIPERVVTLVLFVRRRVCAYGPCGQVFYICIHCDRGQACCREVCGYCHRRAQCNEADRKYQATKKGKLAHAKRQQAYRQRQGLAEANTLRQKVTDQGPDKPRRFATVSLAEGIAIQMTKQPTSMGQAVEKNRHGFARCSVCGRLGVPPVRRR